MDVTALLKSYLTPNVSPLDLAEALTLGLLGDTVRTFHVCGVVNTTASWADVWGPGGVRINPSSAMVVQCYSSSTTDTSSGNGARAVEITGWDENWNLATETINLNGTTAVASISKYERIISVRVTTAGSNGANTGVLSFEIDSKVMATIAIGDNAGFHSHFTVPPNHVGYVYGWRFSAAKGGGQIDYGAIRFYVAPTGNAYYPHEQHALTEGAGLTSSGPLLIADQQTELVVRAKSTGTGSERYVATSYHVAVIPAS